MSHGRLCPLVMWLALPRALTLLGGAAAAAATGDFRFAAVLGDQMVLQRAPFGVKTSDQTRKVKLWNRSISRR